MGYDGWRKVYLRDLIDIKHGFAFKGEFFRTAPPGDILLTPGNFAIGGGFKYDKLKYYDGPVPENFVLSADDLLVTMTDLSKETDTLGYPALVPETPSGQGRYLHNQRLGLVLITAPEELNRHFLYYLMCSQPYRHEIVAGATGTTVRHTSPSKIKAYRASLPPMEHQQRIADILGSLDDRIELNRRTNRVLEDMARAIFKAWFIDFLPVRWKAAQAGNQPSPPAPLPEVEGGDPAAAFGMPQEVFDQLPDRFTDSELGPVPEGWEVDRVESVCAFNYGKALKAADRRGGDVPVYGSNGIVGAHDEALVSGPGVVVGRKGNPGTVNWVDRDFFPIDTTFYVSSELPLSYLRYALEQLNLAGYGSDSAVPGLSRKMAYSLSVLVPDREITAAFDAAFQTMQSFESINARESRVLAELRDTLLPELISGELRVPEIEANLE